MKNFKKLILLTILATFNIIKGFVHDNKHFPFMNKPILYRNDTCIFLRVEPFYMFSDESYGKDTDDKVINLFNIYGKYNQEEVENALIEANLLEKNIIPQEINAIWQFPGKLDAFGINSNWYYQFSPYWEIGSSIYLLKARSKLEFALENQQQYSIKEITDSTDAKDTALQANGIKNLTWDKTGFGDLDFYLRLGASRDYFLKCRKIGAGMKLGVVAPTGVEIDLDNPASVPFGNGGFWATYVDLGIDTELKEDIFAGLDFRFIHHFSSNKTIRMPLISEPERFGVIKGLAEIKPGFTLNFMPYIAFTSLRDGFGAMLTYSLAWHNEDHYKDLRKDKTLEINLPKTKKGWATEHITATGIYDFGYMNECLSSTPRIFLDIDIPVNIISSKNANKTYGIGLRIESSIW